MKSDYIIKSEENIPLIIIEGESSITRKKTIKIFLNIMAQFAGIDDFKFFTKENLRITVKILFCEIEPLIILLSNKKVFNNSTIQNGYPERENNSSRYPILVNFIIKL